MNKKFRVEEAPEKCHGGCPSWGVAECSCPCERATPRACGHQAGGGGVQSGHQAGGGGVQRGPTPVARAEPVGGAILRAGGLGVPRVSALWVRIMPCSGVRRPVARAEFCDPLGSLTQEPSVHTPNHLVNSPFGQANHRLTRTGWARARASCSRSTLHCCSISCGQQV